ncbi:hypothetical protein KSS87_023663 [Heliosperma pusillum]|nr:hypothetical protein KSS87_023663 [Heliosperma pusillum]
MATVDKYNLKNPAVKRILQEVKEMQSHPSDDFISLPLEENIFEWQFAIRGPGDTEFEGGIFHGRIQLPVEYPLKPPSFMLLTPNGRFETQTKICLSISNHHPEHWQPSWSVRTALVALIAFMPTAPNGALGSLDYKKEERRRLAILSREAPPKFGTPDRQKVIDEIHAYMLSKAPPLSSTPKQSPEEQPNEEAASSVDTPNAENSEAVEEPAPIGGDGVTEEARVAAEDTGHVVHQEARQVRAEMPTQLLQHNRSTRVQKSADDRFLTLAAVGLTIAIAFLVLKKLVKSYGYGAIFMSES